MDKPHDIELFEKFLKVEKRLGRSEEELIKRMEDCLLWFVEKRIKAKLESRIEEMALPKVLEIAQKALTEEVVETLSSS